MAQVKCCTSPIAIGLVNRSGLTPPARCIKTTPYYPITCPRLRVAHLDYRISEIRNRDAYQQAYVELQRCQRSLRFVPKAQRLFFQAVSYQYSFGYLLNFG